MATRNFFLIAIIVGIVGIIIGGASLVISILNILKP